MKKTSKKIQHQHIEGKFNELKTLHNDLKSKTKHLSGNGRQNPVYKRISRFDQLIANMGDVFSKERNNLILNEEHYGNFKEFLKQNFTKKEKPELLEILSAAIATSYRLKILLDLATKNEKILMSIVKDLHLQTAQSEQNRQSKKNLKEEADEQRLQECLDMFLKGLKRDPIPTDYPKFVRSLKSKYPLPLYVKKPRLTKEEKLLPKEEQEMLRTIKSDPNWKDGRLRDFWKLRTGLSARTKKLTTLK